MSQTSYLKSVAFTKHMEFNESVEINGNLKCSSLIVHGDLTVSGFIISTHSLVVTGNVKVGSLIEAGRMLKVAGNATARGDISARNIFIGKSISAGASIRALESITAGDAITAGGAVEAAQSIHCGGPIQAGSWILCTALDIHCTEIRNRLLPLGREFWANLPMLSKWRTQILDPKIPWLEIRRLATQQEIKEIAATHFGHWSLEGQLHVFLGIQGKVDAPYEARIAPSPLKFAPFTPAPEPPSRPIPTASSNPLLSIVLSTVKTPFPDYSNNASYLDILKDLKQANILDMDLRQAYPDMNINLGNIYTTVNGLTVPDPAVKQQILDELNAAGNVRLISTNTTIFINSTILADNLKIQYVGGMVTVEDDDACSFNILGIIESILGGLSVIPEAGAIFTILDAVLGLLQNGWAGGVDNVDAAYNQLIGLLSVQFGKMLAVNGLIAQTLLTDWGKLNQANALIINGTLGWPADDSGAVTSAANSYEIEVFKVLFPLHWGPTFTVFNDTGWNCSSCGANVIWAGNGYAGPTHYWLTYGQYWWGDCHLAENELARIGVSIGDLTQGTGRWGSTIWSWIRQNCAGVQQRPNCCSKS